jgi:inner membrane protein YidH
MSDAQRPLDPRDYSRRTLLANERTYLAWWRTGLTTLTVALAAARVVPELADVGTRWPYTILGVGFAALGLLCMGYGERRRIAVDRAVRAGDFAELDTTVSRLLSYGGFALGVALVVVILVDG